MITFPTFVATIADADLGQLAARSGVGVDEIRAIADGRVPSLSVRMRLAAALGELNPFDLFRLGDPDLERAATVDVEAQGHPRYVADRGALRSIDEATR
jgi:hypothetical protein